MARRAGNSRMDLGNSVLHEELEKKVAKFVGKEAALVYTMGYNTNVVTLAALMGKDFIISDNLNHTSL